MGEIKAQGLPSRNPADDGLAGVMRTAFGKLLQNVDNCLPATVVSYDRKRNVATVRPLVQVVAASGDLVQRAPVAAVPVLALGSGEYFINFPLKPGHLGWIHASDRDISLFKQQLKEAKPNTFRKHSFEDSLFIPDIYRDYTIDAEDMDANLVLQHKDGKVRVAVWQDRVKITTKETSLTVQDNGEIIAVAPVKMLLDTPLVEITGIFRTGTGKGGKGTSTINGALHTTQDITSNTDVNARTVSLYNHTHKGVEPGPGITADPVK